MKQLITKKTHLVISIFVLVLSAISLQAQNKKPIALDDIYAKGTFQMAGVSGFTSLNDSRYYCNMDNDANILRYEFSTGNLIDTIIKHSDLIFDNSILAFGNFEFSADENKILFSSNTESLYRHSTQSNIFVYDVKKKKLTQPFSFKVMNATFSPDGNKLAYVKNNNLFYYDLFLNKEETITTDGKVNNIINGATDWVYEEEFAIWKGFTWSPNSDKIAFYRFDESKVKEFEMTMFGKLYPSTTKFKYPKAGETNSTISILVYDLRSELNAEMEIGKEADIYIPRMQFTKDNNTLAIQRLNRLQNKLEILLANTTTGKSTVIYTEENKFYVDITDNLTFLADNKTFIITSERNGFNHLYQYDLKGKLVKQITNGSFDVDGFYGIDEKTKTIFYSSPEFMVGKTSNNLSAERFVYSIGLNGKNKKNLTPKHGWNSPTFNSSLSYFLNTYSNINTPPIYTINTAAGNTLRVLENNEKLNNKLANYVVSKVQFMNIRNEVGDDLNAFIIKPENFDETKKYPVIMYAYNGPGHQLAVDRWMGSNYYYYQVLANKGYIIFCADGRGTGFKGEAFKKCTYLNLGKLEIEDQIYLAKSVGKLSYVDAARIGFWGWSFGGYMASLAISKGADVFKSTIAVAPVTNWRYYDNIYTERYMRTPQENGKNYDDNSPINHVEKIKGNYLIIHGTADDNVHFQNTVEMLDAMIKRNVNYDSEFYPNKNHGISGGKTRYHLYDKMLNFWLEKL
ncbi:MAG: S9 family peptidase [Bacteroidia bacterium]|nr:S9 family peptidase [Bacteroidia bacterium]